MKSKRQDELPRKTLSRPMYGWPEFFQQNGSRILLGLTLAVLAAMIIRYRIESTRARQLTAKASVVRARGDLQQLRQDTQLSTAAPEQLATRRDQLTAQIMADLSEALADAGDSNLAVRADAYAIRGDLYWTLANSPVFPEAATRPSLATKESPDNLLTQAEADYKHVVEQYPGEMMDWATAQLGLAAIAENRSNWDEAVSRYQEVSKRGDAPDMIRSTAQIRLNLLDRLRQPVLVGPYPPASAATVPAVISAATMSATPTAATSGPSPTVGMAASTAPASQLTP